MNEVYTTNGIPLDWELRPFKSVFSYGKGLAITKENLQESGIPCLSYGQVHSKYPFEVSPDKHQLPFVDPKYLLSDKKSLLNKGDFVFADTSEDIEGAGNFTQLISLSQVFAGYHTIIARPKINADHRYLAYLMESEEYRNQIRSQVKGVKVYSITKRILGSTKLWLPCLKLQKSISLYLDKQTAGIDSLISEKQNFINLLKEKRQALISHVVTKGLDLDVEMKDSGVEWIGEIPKHWKVKRLKHITKKVGSGKTPSGGAESYVSEGVIFLRSQNVHNDGLRLGDVVRIAPEVDEEMRGSRVFPNDVLLNITGASIGRACIAPSNIEPANVNQHVCIIRLNDLRFPEFISFLMTSDSLQYQVRFFQTGAGREGLNFSQIGNFAFALPPADECKIIVDYLGSYGEKIDHLVSETKKSIELLKEHRTALISAAVTGKIDLRDKEVA